MKIIKFLIILILLVGIFGSAGYFGYELYLKPKQQLAVEKELPVVPPPAPPDPSLDEIEKGMTLFNTGQRDKARALFEQILEVYPGSPRIGEVKTMLGNMNADLILTPVPGPDKVEHIVVRGDALAKIAKQHDSSAELIMRANDMDSTMLQIGMRLLVPKVNFTMRIDSVAGTVTLFQNGQFFKEYQASTVKIPGGKPSAPVTLKVTEKLAWHDGKRVAFGSKEYLDSQRWIQISRPGLVIYSDDGSPGLPTSGIGLSPSDMEELHTLCTRNIEVELR